MAYLVKCPGCPPEAAAIGPKNTKQDLAQELDRHIRGRHMGGGGTGGVSAFPTTGQDSGGTFWAPWYTGDNCHS